MPTPTTTLHWGEGKEAGPLNIFSAAVWDDIESEKKMRENFFLDTKKELVLEWKVFSLHRVRVRSRLSLSFAHIWLTRLPYFSSSSREGDEEKLKSISCAHRERVHLDERCERREGKGTWNIICYFCVEVQHEPDHHRTRRERQWEKEKWNGLTEFSLHLEITEDCRESSRLLGI